METLQVLEKVGLNEKEASVYLALLELGTASVLSIAVKAGLKRPTTYLILDDLVARGLVSLVPQSKKALYTAEAPERLISDIRKKEELLKRFLPNLEALHNAKKEKPNVQLFQGKEGVRQVYEKVFEKGEVWFFGTIREVSRLDPQGLKDFLKKTKESRVQVREIITDTLEDREYSTKWRGQSDTHHIRFIPTGMNYAVSDSAVFGDSVVFFSFHPQAFAVMITSREISGTLRTLFEMAWQSAVK